MIHRYGGICCNIAVIRVFNNTDLKLENIKIFYENKLGKTSMEIKNIKPLNSKQTGLHTMNAIKDDIKMEFKGKAYTIKEGINKGYIKTLIVKINGFDTNGDMNFTAEEDSY